MMGIEPTYAGTTTQCLNHLATPTMNRESGAPGWIRTSDQPLRRRLLYPLSYERQSTLI